MVLPASDERLVLTYFAGPGTPHRAVGAGGPVGALRRCGTCRLHAGRYASAFESAGAPARVGCARPRCERCLDGHVSRRAARSGSGGPDCCLHGLSCERCRIDEVRVNDVVVDVLRALRDDTSPGFGTQRSTCLLDHSPDGRIVAAPREVAASDSDEFVRLAAASAADGERKVWSRKAVRRRHLTRSRPLIRPDPNGNPAPTRGVTRRSRPGRVTAVAMRGGLGGCRCLTVVVVLSFGGVL